MKDFDVCVIGSGAGGGPVAWAVAEAGYRVVVLEKGPWLRESDFAKDEVGEVRRNKFAPREHEEPRVLDVLQGDGRFVPTSTGESGIESWTAACVGGATNVMSGFFLRSKPEDFRLRSTYGEVAGADVVDWPIDYDAMEPWYDRVEREVGVSGRVVAHPRQERRSSATFPFPPTSEHVLASRVDEAGARAGLHPIPTPRAILSRDWRGRSSCSYTGFCGSYGCTTGAKGSSRAALLDRAVASGRCEVRPLRTVRFLETDGSGAVVAVHHAGRDGAVERLDAAIVVVACQPIETARLLLLSRGPRHPRGLGNGNDLVGRYLLSSAGGTGWGSFPYAGDARARDLSERGAFVNRTIQDWLDYVDPATDRRRKGGNVDFLLAFPGPIQAAMVQSSAVGEGSRAPIFGRALQSRILHWARDAQHLKFEVFADWMPHAEGRVTLDPDVRDTWGIPVARVRFTNHPAQKETSDYLTAKATDFLRSMGARDVRVLPDEGYANNLVAGGARFGRDPKTSVLDVDCRVHDADNVYVTDSSFMPTGGSAPYTFTIYANSFRVAERIVARLGGPRTK